MARQKISLNTSLKEAIIFMSEGNPGALRVLCELVKSDPMTGMVDVLHLDDMNIRGSQIWVGYKDYCREDIEKFRVALRERNKEMVEIINQECQEEQSVVGGASYER